jgi:hypothetical protein
MGMSKPEERTRETATEGQGLLASPFFRLLAINWLIGAFAAVLVLGGLLWLDTGGLRSLILNSPEPWLPIVVLLFGLMITLCSAAMGAAVMALPSEADGGNDRGLKARVAKDELAGLALVPVPARARPSGSRAGSAFSGRD